MWGAATTGQSSAEYDALKDFRAVTALLCSEGEKKSGMLDKDDKNVGPSRRSDMRSGPCAGSDRRRLLSPLLASAWDTEAPFLVLVLPQSYGPHASSDERATRLPRKMG